MTKDTIEYLLWCCTENEKAKNDEFVSTLHIATELRKHKPRMLIFPTSISEGRFPNLDKEFWDSHDFESVAEVLVDGDITWVIGTHRDYRSPFVFKLYTKGLRWIPSTT